MAHATKQKAAAKPKLHGLRRPIALTLPPELVDELDAIAAREDRTRVKTIEIACRQFVQSYRPAAAAAPPARHLAPPTARERAVRGGKAA